ncbi:MAG: alpha/beta hydrolase [Chromatiales bacterium]|jgi:epsilon-lactone hydrolase|nr:alpha/beta hydrolase [Chromatiales bacterium]
MSEILAVREYIKQTAPPADASRDEIRRLREEVTAKRPIADGVQFAPIDLGGVAAERLATNSADAARAIVHLHGGGYVFGSPATHRTIGAYLAAEGNVPVYMVDYRLAPEHPYPAALEDALAAFEWLEAQGLDASAIAVSGDSAGGGLALSLCLTRAAQKLALPASLLLQSPWTDLSCSFDTYDMLEGVDPSATRERLLSMAKLYVGDGGDLRDPIISPCFADLTGMPPTLIQVGGSEAMMGDSIALYGQARRHGVSADLEVWPEMIHVWHQYTDMLDDARRALSRAIQFAQQHWTAARAAAE